MRKATRVALSLVGALAVVFSTVAVGLTILGNPDGGRSLRFQGFIPLPGKGIVQVLDYLSIYNRQLFAPSISTGDVYKIGLGSKLLPGVADVFTFKREPAAHGVVVDPVSGIAFVTRSGANAVDAFDPSTMRLVRRIAVADDPDAILYDQKDRLIYVASGDSMAATLIDPAKLKAVATTPLGGSPEFGVFDAKTELVYQNLASVNALVAVNVASRRIAWRYALTQCELPTGMAIDESDRRLFIACGKSARLVIFDLNRRRVVTSVSIGFGPDSVAYDPELHRIYTTGRLGRLSIIEQESADAYRVVDTISLHFNAHTLVVDPETHQLFVGYTGFVFQPRLAVFSPIRQP